MQLQALKEGDPVTLEVIWGGVIYPLNSTLFRVRDDGVWMKAFYKNGQLLDFSNRAFKEAQFNLYGFIDGGKTRIVWKNITITLKKQDENIYYHISPAIYARESMEANRRENDRVKVLISGSIHTEYGTDLPIMIKDISNSGIGFSLNVDCDLVARPFELSFTDEVRGTTYNMKIKCRGARKVDTDSGCFIGCKIESGPKNLLYYIYYKTVEVRVGEDAYNKQKETEEKTVNVGTGMHFFKDRR